MPTHHPTNPETLLEHAGFVRAAARAAIGRDDQVEDAVQDTWAAALTKGPREARSLRAWLGAVARNRALDLVRMRGHSERRERRAARGEYAPSALSVIERAETGRILVRAVMELPPVYRDAILLRYYDGLLPKRIGQVLGIPTETARTRVRRGLERLRNVLDGRHGGDRRRWTALLAPLVRAPASAGAGGLALGTLIMKKAAVVLLVLVAGVVVWQAVMAGSESRTSSGAGPPPPSPARAEISKKPVLEARDVAPAPRGGPGEHLAATPENSVTLRGRVLDARRRPVGGAEVRVWTSHAKQGLSRGVSQADGVFELVGFPRPERVTEFLVRADHGAQAGMIGRSIKAQTPDEIDVGVVVLRPAHELHVVVQGKEGTPLEKARVWVEANEPIGGARTWGTGWGGLARTPTASAFTTADGACRFHALPVGTYRVLAQANGHGREVVTVRLPRREAAPLVLPLGPPRNVVVLVSDAWTGEPIAGATLLVEEHFKSLIEGNVGQVIPHVPEIDGLVTNAQGRAALLGIGLRDAVLVSAMAEGYAKPDPNRGVAASRIVDGEIHIKLKKLREVRWPLAADEEHAPVDGTVLKPERAPGGWRWLLPVSARIENGHVVAEGCVRSLFRCVVRAPDGTYAHLLAMPSRDVGAAVTFQPTKKVVVIVKNADGTAAAGLNVSVRSSGNLVIVDPTPLGPGGRLAVDVSSNSRVDVFIDGRAAPYAAIGSLNLRGRDGGTVRHTLPGVGHPVELVVLIDGERRLPAEYWLRHGPGLLIDAEEDPEHGILRFAIPPSAEGVKMVYLGAKDFLTTTIDLPEVEGDAVLRRRAVLRREGRCLLRIKPPADGNHQIMLLRDGAAEPESRLRVFESMPVDLGQEKGWLVVRHGPLEAGTYHAIDRTSHSRSAPVEIKQGEEANLDFDLSAVRYVRGTVEVPTGYLAGRARVKMSGEGLYEPLSWDSMNQDVGVRPAGTFKVRIPGSGKVRLTALHPRLVAAVEGGSIEIGPQTDEVHLMLVEGGSASFTLDPPIPSSAPSNPRSYVTVLLYEGVPKGEALQVLRPAHQNGVFTVAGFEPGTYTLVVSVPDRAPAVLEGVALGDTKADLGTILLPAGASVRIKLLVKDGEDAPSIVASAQFSEGIAYWRGVTSRGEREVLLRGLGVGRFELRASPVRGLINGRYGGSQSVRRTLESDGHTEIVVEMDLR